MSPTHEHQIPLELIRNCPELMIEIAQTVYELDVPSDVPVTPGSEALAESDPLEFNCDGTYLVGQDARHPRHVLILEPQRQWDEDKVFTWPAYHANARARFKCPVLVIVLCYDDTTAKKCRRPIALSQPDSYFVPLVLTLRDLRLIFDPEEAARNLELATLALLGREPGAPGFDQALDAWTSAIDTDPDKGRLYYHFMVDQAGEAFRRVLEERMNLLEVLDPSKSKSAVIRETYAKGEVRGEAKSILVVLESRDVAIGEADRERILSCTDVGVLERWLAKVGLVTSTTELFAE